MHDLRNLTISDSMYNFQMSGSVPIRKQPHCCVVTRGSVCSLYLSETPLSDNPPSHRLHSTVVLTVTVTVHVDSPVTVREPYIAQLASATYFSEGDVQLTEEDMRGER